MNLAKIGQKFTRATGKNRQEETIIDIYITKNSKNETVKTVYVTEYLFAGQIITDYDVPLSTIARALLSL